MSSLGLFDRFIYPDTAKPHPDARRAFCSVCGCPGWARKLTPEGLERMEQHRPPAGSRWNRCPGSWREPWL